jgi:hypothetical protein
MLYLSAFLPVVHIHRRHWMLYLSAFLPVILKRLDALSLGMPNCCTEETRRFISRHAHLLFRRDWMLYLSAFPPVVQKRLDALSLGIA